MGAVRWQALKVTPVSLPPPLPRPPQCNETWIDALEKAEGTWTTRQGIQLAGYADKLPSPELGITFLVPSNGAWGRFAWHNGLLFGILSSLGETLTSIITYHILPTALSPEAFATPGAHSSVLFLFGPGGGPVSLSSSSASRPL